jgi:hypothetical protein
MEVSAAGVENAIGGIFLMRGLFTSNRIVPDAQLKLRLS